MASPSAIAGAAYVGGLEALVEVFAALAVTAPANKAVAAPTAIRVGFITGLLECPSHVINWRFEVAFPASNLN
jgi:hypothetical protein